ncbi:MAG TPA: tetratricopeptide repeat protein [Methanosarcina sp.]|nr:tetratricopeptide repeat protein [Methanosarcina sp.]
MKNLEVAEDNYHKAFELAKNLEMPLQEAKATRGLGIVASKKGNMDESEKYFRKSVEILRKLGAPFELQKTTLEYAKALYENNNHFEAETRAKSVAFDAQKSKNYELLRKTYLLLGDIAAKQDDKYEYYLKSLETSEFNPKIYVRNCYHLIFRMQKMDQAGLMKFITLLKEQNDEKYFDLFLEALNNKIEGKKYDLSGLPGSLVQELEKIEAISISNN